jgi:hypothetical protein
VIWRNAVATDEHSMPTRVDHAYTDQPTKPAGAAVNSPPTIDRSTQERIGYELSEMYVRLKSEPVPQHIRDLLIRLDLATCADER